MTALGSEDRVPWRLVRVADRVFRSAALPSRMTAEALKGVSGTSRACLGGPSGVLGQPRAALLAFGSGGLSAVSRFGRFGR